MRYRYLDHTSDLGVEIFGQDLEELFVNSLFAISDNILDLNTVEIKETKNIELSAQTTEDLLMDWLRELVFIFATQFFIAKQVNQITIKDNKLSAQISGEKYDAARHIIKIEIKTPTYHMFKIDQTDQGYQATVIFDV
jgi:SHS2 domain-containing protein